MPIRTDEPSASSIATKPSDAGAAPRALNPQPAWSEQELRSDPHSNAAKPEKVRAMFGAIAHAYDLNNRLHSFGRDQAWRRAALKAASLRAGDHVLDVACGTGDLTRLFARAQEATSRSGGTGSGGRVVGLDFTPRMLDVATDKSPGSIRVGEDEAADALAMSRTASVLYVDGDATRLPFPAASFDVVSIAFGIRNVSDPDAALREFHRVLRPGGRLVILEFSRPRFAPVAWMNDLWCNVVMPRTATWISRDKSGAYKYLPRSVRTFLSREAMAEHMSRAGFGAVSARALTFGVCVCYRGVKR